MTKFDCTLAFATAILALGCGATPNRATAPMAGSESETEAPSKQSKEQSNDVPPASPDRTGEMPSVDVAMTQPAHSENTTDAPDSAPAPTSGTKPTASTKTAKTSAAPAAHCRESDAKLALSVDRRSVSLEDGRLQAKMDGPICNLTMRITSKEGQPILEQDFAVTELERELRWNAIPRDQIEKVEIRITARDGAYQSVFLIPWSVAIDHEEVQFDTNKAVIRESEMASLNDSLTKVNDVLAKVEGKGLGTITLFIAGHTDTQGSDAHNLVLSRNRAEAIANWFMKKGLCIPIAYEGFGETALKKLTADNVDEQANRRVDYILSVEPPVIKKGAAPAWKWMSKGCP